MRILLVNPPFQRLNKVASTYFPLGLGYLAAFLEQQGHDAKIFNAELADDREKKDWVTIDSNRARMFAQNNFIRGLEDARHPAWRQARMVIKEFRPALVGITATSSAYPAAAMIAEITKSIDPAIVTVLGGVHATVEPARVLQNPCFDAVVIGEGELTIAELSNALHERELWSAIKGIAFRKDGQVIINAGRAFIDALDQLPFPARHLDLHQKSYGQSGMGGLITARGCPANCSFCNAKNLWSRRVRFRSTASVCAELAQMRERYSPTYLLFYDDTFTIQKKRVVDICNFLISNHFTCGWGCFTRADCLDEELLALMKKAGCSTVGLGLESGSERILAMLDKGESLASIREASRKIKEAGISLGVTCMVGLPQETEEDIRATIAVVKEIKADFTNVNTFTPYSGTPLHEYCRARGLIADDFDWSRLSQHSHYNQFCAFLAPERFIALRDELIAVADGLNEEARFKNNTAPAVPKAPGFTARLKRKIGKIIAGEETFRSLKKTAYRNVRDFYFMRFVPAVMFVNRTVTFGLNVLFAVTIARIWRGRGVLHIMHASHVGYVLTRALRQTGVAARYLAIGDSFLQYDTKAYDYHFSTKNAPDGFIFQSLAPRAFMNNILFWRFILPHRIVHSHALNSITSSDKEFWFLKLAGRKIVFHFRGCDVREKNEVEHRWPFLNCCEECDYPAQACFNQARKSRLEDAKKYGDAFLVTTPDLLLHVPQARVVSFLSPPEELVASLRKQRDYRALTRWKIYHATNHPGIDGTKYLESAVERLTREGYAIKLTIARAVPFQENLRKLADCDISVGKLKMGYFANAQIESMALGIPTFCFVREEFLQYTHDAPVINANAHTIYEKLKYYLDNPHELTMISQKSVAFTQSIDRNGSIMQTLKKLYGSL